jgi:hypothetical protein
MMLMVEKQLVDGRVYDEPYGGEAIGQTDSPDGSAYWLLDE